MQAATAPRIAILACPDSTASTVYGMYDLFRSAGRDWSLVVDGRPGQALLQPRIVAARREPFVAGNEVTLAPHATFDDEPRPDVVCVPELMVSPDERIEGRYGAEAAWLRRCHAAGATIAAACSGAVLLAEAGLLEDQDATTHWAYCQTLRRQYPRVRVHPQRALVVSGEGQRLVMAGGGTSWFDLALYLIARLTDVEVAMQVAKLNLIDWHEAGQQPFARLARTRQVDDATIARCQAWIAEHYAEPAPVASLVRLSGLPERSFKRRFAQATGMSPLEYVHTVRLEEAKQALEAGDAPVEAIANEVGYEDPGFFSRLFRRQVGLTPAQYRRRFAGMRRAIVAADAGRARPARRATIAGA
jgi:transcriptional regulator GlxA family with amidase domain